MEVLQNEQVELQSKLADHERLITEKETEIIDLTQKLGLEEEKVVESLEQQQEQQQELLLFKSQAEAMKSVISNLSTELDEKSMQLVDREKALHTKESELTDIQSQIQKLEEQKQLSDAIMQTTNEKYTLSESQRL